MEQCQRIAHDNSDSYQQENLNREFHRITFLIKKKDLTFEVENYNHQNKKFTRGVQKKIQNGRERISELKTDE